MKDNKGSGSAIDPMLQNAMRDAFLVLALSWTAFAGQSVQVASGTPSVTLPSGAPWNTLGLMSERWELRIHNFSPDWPTHGVNLGPVNLYQQPGTGNVWADTSWNVDTLLNNGAIIYNCCAGRTDLLVRVQRDMTANQYTFDICDVTGGNCLSASTPIVAIRQTSWGGIAIQLTTGYQLGFLRWYSTLVPAGTPIRPASAMGDLGDWEFEGNLNDSSGHSLNMTGGTVSYATTPSYPPVCNAGAQQSFRAGYPAQLDGSSSYALDGGSFLSYLWQLDSGPPGLIWTTGHGLARSRVNGLIFGSYVFRLTVTDSSNQSASCIVKHGAVATDNNDIVITDNSAVDTLLGPMVRYGANPWPWFDNRNKQAADNQIAAMDPYYSAYWDVPGQGTVTVTGNSAAVTGAGTTFTTTFCQGPASPAAPQSGAAIIVWYPTGVPGQTGRRQWSVASCQSDTQLTLSKPWKNDVPDGSGLNYTYVNVNSPGMWAYNAAPANYYDNVAAFYALYYRSGIDDYLTAARKLADRFWTCPQIDRGEACVTDGTGTCFPARSQSTLGLILRALDGRPDMWAGLHVLWNTFMGYYLNTVDPQWGLWDEREEAYHLAMISYCALYDTDATYRTNCKNSIRNSFSTLWTPTMSSDGSWPGLYVNSASWTTTPNTSVTLAHGSPIVTGNGTNWSASSFPTGIWFTNSSAQPAHNTDGDPTVYTASWVSPTQLALDRGYEGNAGQHGWETSPYGVYGWTDQPFMIGILSAAFDLAATAIADVDPATSQLAHSYNVVAANWLKNYGYWPLQKGLYYFAQSVNCPAPISDSSAVCTGGNDAGQARTLSAEALRGITRAYAYSKDPALKDFADQLYNAMFAKPGTCPTGSTICVPDGNYINPLDDGQYMISGTPPPPKWLGMFFGFSALSSWPGYRIGGLSPANSGTLYVGADFGSVPGAAKVRVTTTEPSGRSVQTECSASPCAVNVDRRQGDHLIALQYLSATGAVLASTTVSAMAGK